MQSSLTETSHASKPRLDPNASAEKSGSYFARVPKTHLSALLDRVLKGEEITITRHGVPVARLVPVTPRKRTGDIQATIDALRTFRKGNKLNGLSLRDLISEGRL